MGTINVVATILAARMILLVSVVGSIWLSWLALEQPDIYRLACLSVYAVVVVAPLVWLAGLHR